MPCSVKIKAKVKVSAGRQRQYVFRASIAITAFTALGAYQEKMSMPEIRTRVSVTFVKSIFFRQVFHCNVIFTKGCLHTFRKRFLQH